MMREATIKDLGVLIKLLSEFAKFESSLDPDLKFNQDSIKRIEKGIRERFDNTVKGLKYRYYLVEKDRVPVGVGYVQIHPAIPEFGWISQLFILPEYRKQGIGTLLLKTMVDWLTKEGIKKIRLNVFKGNIPAIRFYESLGFKFAEERYATYQLEV